MKLLLALLLVFAGKDSLDRIVADTWQHRLANEPALRLQEGLPVENLPDLSDERWRQEAAFARGALERLARIDTAALSHDDWLTHAVLKWELEQAVEAEAHADLDIQITPYAFPLPGTHEVFTRHTFSSRDDAARYLRLLRQYPRHLGQIQARAERQRSRGILIPKETVDQMVPLIRAFIQPPERCLFTVAPERLGKLEGKEAFDAQVAKIIQEEINPSLERLAGMLGEDYRKAAPDRVGLGQYPGGPEAYRFAVRFYTGLNVTPEEVHRRGLEEVARLEARMAEIRRQVGFTGTQREFNDKLRTDPRFLAKTPEEAGERLMAPVRKIEPLIGKYFLRTPKAPYGVKRLDPALEGSMTFGFYEKPSPADPSGWYLFNGSKLDQRPIAGAAALIYHELLPGHHFQIALQLENESLPPLRQNLHTAFVEGWAEYASELGIEMGLYDDPYALYGRLAMDMFLSNRLVVDTGMNALGWPRSKAVEFMRERLLETGVQIDSETLRYSTSIPGQALAYKMGSAKIWELRRRAERELGPKFDIRRFHEAVLGSGSLPLSVLERHIDWWIAQQKGR